MQMSFFLKKATAILTTVLVLATSDNVSGYASFFATIKADSYPSSDAPITGPGIDLALPPALGVVSDAHFYPNEKLVINIQDLHCHGEVQKNIAHILALLDKKYHLQKIYLEGNTGAVDTGWVTAISDNGKRKKIIETLLSAGRLTGAEYFSINSGRYSIIEGVENEKEYTENIVRLGTLMLHREEIQGELKKVRRQLKNIGELYWGTRNKRLHDLVSRYKSGDLESSVFYRDLFKLSAESGVLKDYYPMIAAYLASLREEKRISIRRVNSDMRDLMMVFKKQLPYGRYRALSEAIVIQGGAPRWIAGLEKESVNCNIDLAKEYPSLWQYLQVQKACAQFHPGALLSEERRLIDHLHTILSENRAEREVCSLWLCFRAAEEFFSWKIDPETYSAFLNEYAMFSRLCQKYNVSIAGLDRWFEIIKQYYATNLTRSRIFLQNIPEIASSTSGRSSQGHHAPFPEAIVVITGGFHTEGIIRECRRSRMSCLAITPRVSTASPIADEVYAELISGQANRIVVQTTMQEAISKKLAALPPNDRITAIESMAQIAEADLLKQHPSWLHNFLAWIRQLSGRLFQENSIVRDIRLYLSSRNMDNITIHKDAIELIRREAAAMDTHNIEWVVRSILGKSSSEAVHDDELRSLLEKSQILPTVMLYSPVIRKDNVLHPNTLKKDVAIKGGIRVFSPVMAEAIVSRMIDDLKTHNVEGIIRSYRKSGRRLSVLGKYTGGLTTGLIMAQKLGLPFDTLTKRSFSGFETGDLNVASIDEPHLPPTSPERTSYMVAYPGSGVIFVDDEATKGNVLINTVQSLEALGVKTEVSAIVLQSTDEAGTRLREMNIPFYALCSMNHDQDARPQNPEYIPMKSLSVSAHQRVWHARVAARDIPIKIYRKKGPGTNAEFFVDHQLRGMTLSLDPELFESVGWMIEHKVEEMIGGIGKRRKEFYEKSKTLYLLGLTPSGLYPAVAGSLATRLPLVGVTNQSQPAGYAGTLMDYINLDGYGYYIYALEKGDGVVIISGEITDGEEQLRVIKTLKDHGIEVLGVIAVLENTAFDGRARIESATGTKVASLKTCSYNEGGRRFNTTEQVWSCLRYAIRNLDREIKSINPTAEIQRIEVMPCSFTRGIMMSDSDMDNMFIYVSGIDQADLSRLNERFTGWMSYPGLALQGANEKPPMLLSIERKDSDERRYEVKDIPHITIFEQGKFLPSNDIIRSNAKVLTALNYEKNAARIKLLLLLNELTADHVETLLREEPNHNYIYNDLVEFLRHYKTYPFSGAARDLAISLDNLYTQGIWKYNLAPGSEAVFESALKELSQRGLVRVFNGKIIIVWRLNTLEWSDSFWKKQFGVSSTAKNILVRLERENEPEPNMDENMLRRDLSQDNPLVRERALKYIAERSDLAGKYADAVLECLGYDSVFVKVRAFEIIVKQKKVFLNRIFNCMRESIYRRQLGPVFSPGHDRIQMMIKILFFYAQKDPDAANDIIRFIYDNALTEIEHYAIQERVLNVLIQEIIIHLGKIYHRITDPVLRENIYQFIYSGSRSYVARTNQVAAAALKNIGDRPSSRKADFPVIDEAAASRERKVLFGQFEKRRKAGKAIAAVLADYDETLLHYVPGEQRTLGKQVSFWLNWLMQHGADVVIVTGSTMERVRRTALDDHLPLPLRECPRLHLWTQYGQCYNGRLLPGETFPEAMNKFVRDYLESAGWHEFGDGTFPGLEFAASGKSKEETERVARGLRERLAAEGFKGYSISAGSFLRQIRVGYIDKSVILKHRDLLEIDPERSLFLFDDAGEFGLDKPLVDQLKGGVNVNVGNAADTRAPVYQLSTKNEEGSALAIEALAASYIMGLLEDGKAFDWAALKREIVRSGLDTTSGAESLVRHVQSLVEESSRPGNGHGDGVVLSALPQRCVRQAEEVLLRISGMEAITGMVVRLAAREENAAITGASGDIGATLTKLLHSRHHHIRAVMRNESSRASFLLRSGRRISDEEIVPADITDRDKMKELLAGNNIFYHLAGIVGLDKDPSDNEYNMRINGLAAIGLVKWAEHVNPGIRFIFASTQRVSAIENSPEVIKWIEDVLACIEENDDIFDESVPDYASALKKLSETIMLKHPLPEHVHPYELSKLLVERYLSRSRLRKYVSVRIATVYGPGTYSGRTVQRMVEARLFNQSAVMHRETRDYVYIDDAAEVLYALGTREKIDVHSMDLASGTMSSPEDIWKLIVKHTPEARGSVIFQGPVLRQIAQSSSESRALLGREFTNIETGVRNQIDEVRRAFSLESKHKGGPVLVIDAGGTNTRLGVWDGRRIEDMAVFPTSNYAGQRKESGIRELQNAWIETVTQRVEAYRKRYPDIKQISIAFAGPVNDAGTITKSSVIWGKDENPVPVSRLEQAFGLPVTVVNDLTAAVVRYGRDQKYSKLRMIGLITVSSGIGAKLFDVANNEVVIDRAGRAGEIGHIVVDASPGAITDEALKGELNAYASGRGMANLAARMASEPSSRGIYKKSLLKRKLNAEGLEIASVDKNTLTRLLIECIREKDPFSEMVMNRGISLLAGVLNGFILQNAPDVIIVMGGVAENLGEIYRKALVKELQSRGVYGYSNDEIDRLFVFGSKDDQNGLIGAGLLVYDPDKKNAEAEYDPGYVRELPQNDTGTSEIEAYAPNPVYCTNYFTERVFDPSNTVLAKVIGRRNTIIVYEKVLSSGIAEKIQEYVRINGLAAECVAWEGGENSKSSSNVDKLTNYAFDHKLDRKGIFVVVGGGALMDVVGMVAAQYRRGVDYVRIPTTLLGQVDAAVGVKVGIDYRGAKNLLGGFYPPMATITDTTFLDSLPSRQIRSGLAEIIKIALVSNAGLFNSLEQYGKQFVESRTIAGRNELIKNAALELLKHLQKDFFERNLMRHVDFGHVLAHKFESMTGYELTHGEAVAIDILFSAYVSYRRGILSETDFNRILNLHVNLGLPLFHRAITIEESWKGIQESIAHKGGRLMMVIPKTIGQTVFIDSLSKDELGAALKFLQHSASVVEHTGDHDFPRVSQGVAAVAGDSRGVKDLTYIYAAREDNSMTRAAAAELLRYGAKKCIMVVPAASAGTNGYDLSAATSRVLCDLQGDTCAVLKIWLEGKGKLQVLRYESQMLSKAQLDALEALAPAAIARWIDENQLVRARLGIDHTLSPVRVAIVPDAVAHDAAIAAEAEMKTVAVTDASPGNIAMMLNADPLADPDTLALFRFLSSPDTETLEKADVAIYNGSGNISGLRELLRLYREDKYKEIILSGGYSSATIPLITAAVRENIPLFIEGETVKEGSPLLERLQEVEKIIDVKEQREQMETVLKGATEARLKKQILEYLDKQDPSSIDPIQKHIHIDERSSSSAGAFTENRDLILAFAEKLREEHLQTPLRLLVCDDGLSMARARGAAEIALRDLIRNGMVQLINVALKPDLNQYKDKQELTRAIQEEMWRLIRYSATGEIAVCCRGGRGLGRVPRWYWKSLLRLVNQHPDIPLEQDRFDDADELCRELAVQGNAANRDMRVVIRAVFRRNAILQGQHMQTDIISPDVVSHVLSAA